MTMEALITAVTSIVTAAGSWIGTFVTTVTDNPLLLIFALIPLVGLGVGLLSRLLNVR